MRLVGLSGHLQTPCGWPLGGLGDDRKDGNGKLAVFVRDKHLPSAIKVVAIVVSGWEVSKQK